MGSDHNSKLKCEGSLVTQRNYRTVTQKGDFTQLILECDSPLFKISAFICQSFIMLLGNNISYVLGVSG